MPFLSIIGKSPILKASNKTIRVRSCPKRSKTCKCRKLFDLIRIQIRYLLIVCCFIIICGFEDFHELGHTGTDDHAVLAGSKVQRQIVAVQHLG